MTERLTPKPRSFQPVSFVSSLAGFQPPPPKHPARPGREGRLRPTEARPVGPAARAAPASTLAAQARAGSRLPPRPAGPPRPPGAGEHRRPRECGPSGCRGRCARPLARPRAQLLFKGPAGHVARTQLAAAPAGAPRLGGSAPPPPPRRAGPREESRGARDAGSHGRSGARPGKRPARGRPAAPGLRMDPRGSRSGGGPRRGLLSAASAPRPRVRPTRASRLPSSRPGLGRPKRQAVRGGWAAPTSGERPDFAVTLDDKPSSWNRVAVSSRPLSHWRPGGPAARRQAGGWGGVRGWTGTPAPSVLTTEV